MNAVSLRVRLFSLIILPLILIASLAAVSRLTLAEQTSQGLYDNTLLVVALTISRDVVLSEGDVLAEELLDRLTKTLGDPVYYRITGPGGRFVTGYSDPPVWPDGVIIDTGVPAFFDAVALDNPVRVVVLREFISEQQFGGWVTVEVWQTVRQREALSYQLLYQSIVLMAVVITSAALLVWFGINLGLRPLTDLRNAVARRSPNDLDAIRRQLPRELSALVQTMNRLFAQLADAFAVRDAFISDAAHQLRNPIAAIQAQAEAATTAADEATLRCRVEALADKARRTGRLTQQLLSMEKVRGGIFREATRQIDMRALVETVLRNFAEMMMTRDIEMSFECSGQPYPVVGDAVMLEEALVNVLDNAAAYGCPSGGSIAVSLTFADHVARIVVSDTGPGIPKQDHARVFDRFYRVQDDQTGGCGLGLAIVADVMIAHGGSAAIIPSASGTVVELIVPLDQTGLNLDSARAPVASKST